MSFGSKRAERLQVMLTPAELDALDDWRFARRMPTRAAAIRELLRLGLAADAAGSPAKRRSRDYAVVDSRRGRADRARGGNGHAGNGQDDRA